MMKRLLLVTGSFLLFCFSVKSQTNVCSGTWTSAAANCQAIQIGNGTAGYIRVCITNNSIPSGGGTSCSPGGSCNPPYSGGGWSARMVIYASNGSGYTGAALQTWTAATANSTCYTVSSSTGYAYIFGLCLTAGTTITWSTVNDCGDQVCTGTPPPCTSSSCTTCATACASCGFTTPPTVAQVTANCADYPFTPAISTGQSATRCHTFTANNTTVDFNVIISSTCGTGNVSAFSWTLQQSNCGGILQSGNLSSLTFTGLTIGQQYTYCYTFTVPNPGPPTNSCTHTTHYPYFVGATVCTPPTITASASAPSICYGNSTTLTANCSSNCTGVTYEWSPSGGLSSTTGASVTASPLTTTTYTVTATSSGGCYSTATIAVNVNANPTLAPTTTPSAICAGGSATLAANATAGSGTISSYAWSSGLTGNIPGGSVSPPANTTYTVTVTNSNGCTATANVAVTVNARPTASPTASPAIICNGGSTTLAANATAGSGTISSYAWSSDLTGSVSGGAVSPTSSRTYTVTVTNSNNCTTTASVGVTVNARPIIAPTATPPAFCNGGSSNLLANATPGSGVITTYAWSSGLAGNVLGGTVSPTVTTVYIVTVTNSNNCFATAAVTVTINANPTVAPSATPSGICNGGSTTLAANATAGSGTISSYAWSSGLSGSVPGGSVSPSSNTTYTVTVTNSNGCSATGSVSVAVNARPTVTPSASALVICSGGSTTLAANATAGSGTITSYAWSSGLSGNVPGGSVSPTANTAYNVTVTNSNGCTASASIAVTVNANPLISPTASPAVICNSGSTTLAANATAGSGTITTYSWSSGLAGNVSSGAVSPITNTTYTVTVANSNSCTATASITVAVSTPPSATPLATPAVICSGGSTMLAANATAGSGTLSTYAWSSGLVGNVASGSVSPVSTTTYTVTVTNSNNCTASASIAVTVNARPSVSPTASPVAICNGQNTMLVANATAGSGTISSYAWSSGLAGNISGGPVSPIVNTTYTVTVTNSNNCSATANVAVTVNALPIAVISPATVSICIGASTTLTASGGTGYAWNNSTTTAAITVSPGSTTTYTVTVTDANTCTATASRTVTVNSLPAAAISPTIVTICSGASATLTASGGTGYAWNNSVTTAAITVSPASTTTYTVTVTNASTCTATASRTITVNPLPTPSVSPATISICNGESTTLTVNGGSTYAWSNSATTVTITVSPSTTTTYNATVTDANSCTASVSRTVTVNPIPIAAISPATVSICMGASTTLTASGGTSYAWSNSASTAAITVSPGSTTTYTVTVTDANTCTATASRTVAVNSLPLAAISPAAVTICSGASATLTASGGTGYAWSNSANTAAITVSPASTTTYTVTVTNANTCTATASTTLSVNPLPTPSISPAAVAICNGASATLTANGGTTYAWSNSATTAAITVSPTSAITYTVTVTDANTCTATAARTVIVNALPTSTASNTGPYCSGATIQLTSSGGTTYSWSGPASFNSTVQNPARTGATVLMAGNYTVTVTGANGCTATAATTVVVNVPPAATANNTGPYCTTSTIQLNSGGGISYSWSGPNSFLSSAQNPVLVNSTLAMAGLYTVTVTDGNSCTATTSTNVAVNASLAPVASNTGPFCINGTIQLNVAGGNTYTWSGPNSFTSNSQNPTISNATALMSGTYIVTASDLNGCSGTTSTNVIVNVLPIAVAGNTGPYCEGTTLQLNSSGGTSYSWSGAGSFTSASQNPNRANATTVMSGTYTVTVTDTNNCSSIASTTVIINAPSVANAGADVVLTCTTTQASLNANPIGSGETYSWSGPGIASGNNTASPIVNASGTYTLVVTDANSCTASDQALAITYVTLPNANAGTDATLTCTITSVTLTASSTTPGATFSWSNGTNTEDNTVNVTNTFTVTVTDPSNGCTASDQVVVNSNTTSPNANAGADVTLTCAISSVVLSASSTTPGATFAWSNGINTAVNSISLANTYTVTVTDPSNGCTAADQVVVSSNTTTPNVNAGIDALLTCSANSAILTATSSTTGATFAWSNGVNAANNSVSLANTYIVTVSDPSNGCTASDQVIVSSNTTSPDANAGPDAVLTCSVTSATLTAGSTTPGVTFAWSNGTNTAVNAVTVVNTYTVTVTDPGNGCTSSDQVVVTSSSSLPDVNAGADVTLNCNIASLTLLATSTTPGVAFAWSNGTNTASNTVTTAGTYTVTVTDTSTGCALSDQVIVSSDINIPNANAGADATLTCAISSVSLSASSTTPGATFAWSNGTNSAINPVSIANTYIVTVTDPSNGCSAADQVVVGSNTTTPNVNAGIDALLTCSTNSVLLTATSSTTGAIFAWSNGVNAANNSVSLANTYIVTVTDPSNGCIASDQVIVSSNTTTPNANAGLDETLTCTATSVSLTASSTTPGAVFVWSNGTNGATNSVNTANIYTVTVTDPVNSCTASDQVTVSSDISIPDVDAGSDAILTCTTTSITLVASSTIAGAAFTWSNGTNTAANNVSVANAYTVTVTDPGNGCTASDQVVVSTSSNLPNVDAGTDVTLTCTTTSVTLTATSTTPGVTFAWSNGINAATINVSIANTYTVTVTNPTTGCEALDNVVVISNTLSPDINAGPDATLTCVVNTVTLTANSTTPGATFIWSNGTFGANNSVTAVNTYAVTATDPSNGCTLSDQVVVNSNTTAPDVNAGADATLTCSTTSLVLTASSTIPGATFSWSNSTNTAVNTITVSNTYSVTATDPNNGCTASDQAVVSSNTVSPDVTPGPDEILSCTVASVILTATSTVSGATYLWSNGTATANNTVSLPNIYNVTVTDPANGCTASAAVSAIQNTGLPDVAIVTPVDLTCSVTSVTLTASSTTSGVSYNWGNGILTPTNMVNIAGVYSVTVTDPSNNCSVSASVTVNENIAVPNVTIAPPATLTCSVTSVTLNASSTTPSAIYDWSGGGTGATKTVSTPNTYFVTVTDPVNGCTASSSAVVNSLSGLVLSVNTTDILCNGNSTGGADLTITGGAIPYSIQWSNNTSNEDLIAVTAGNYTVTVIDNAGCIASSSANITEPPAFSLTAIRNNVPCNGGNFGSIVISPSGGTSPYTYSWNDGTTTQNRNFISAGTYSLTVNDFNACTFSISMQITEPAALSVIETHTNVLCNGANTGSINLTTTGGTPPYSFTWSDGNTSAIRNNLSAAGYSVVISDSNSCSTSLSVSISEPTPLVVSGTHTDVLCNGVSSGSISISSSGGTLPYSFAWNDGNTLQVRNGMAAGNYLVTVSDNNSCSSSVSVSITEPPAVVVSEMHTDVLCNGASTGSITISASGGTSPITFSWNDGNTSAIRTGITAGNYSLTISDNNSCSSSQNIIITEPTALTLSETHVNVACSGGTGSIDVTSGGGVAPRTYLWNDGIITEDRNNLLPANYSVTMTDNNSCSSSLSITIGSNSGIVIVPSQTNVSCFGGNNGSITVNVSGGVSPYTYLWNDAVGTPNRTNVTAGSYTLSVNDNNACVQVVNVIVTEPAALSVLPVTANVLCNGGSTGSIDLTTSGGTSPYNFSWNDAVNTEDRANLSAGSYAVTINDNNSCSASLNLNITEPSAINLSEIHSDVLCNGGSNGLVTLTVTGGTIPYFFSWNDGNTLQNRSGLADGNYSVTVLDNNSCSTAQSIVITEPTALVVTEAHSNVVCNGGNDAAINLSVSGGVMPYAFVWNDGNNSQNRINVSAGNYSVTINDNNNCSATQTGIVITEPSPVSVTETHINISCNGYSDGNISLAVAGGTAPYTFVWNDGATSQSRNNVSAGNYSVTVNDNAACPASANVVITEPAGSTLTALAVNPACESLGSNGNITLNVSGGSAPFQFIWSNGSASSTLSNIGPGNYSVTISDANGCNLDSSFTLVYEYDFSVAATPSVTISLGESTTLGYTLSGNAGTYTSLWSPSSTLSCGDCASPVASPIVTGTYQIQITNEAGCSATDLVTVTVVPDHTVFVPNVFSPNGDGNNDVFEIYGNLKGIAYLDMQIFNRWGEKVFESNDHHFKWDGTYRGEMQNPAVFVWKLKLVWVSGHSEELRNGSVTIIR